MVYITYGRVYWRKFNSGVGHISKKRNQTKSDNYFNVHMVTCFYLLMLARYNNM